MTRRAKRLLIVGLVGTALAIAIFFTVCATLNHLVYHHHFVSEARVAAPGGTVTFRPYALHLEDKAHMVQAAFLSKALWPVHHISTEDHDYLFGPFGRVVVLTTVGIHALAVTESRRWTGDPHAFPFADKPIGEQDFIRLYTRDDLHEQASE